MPTQQVAQAPPEPYNTRSKFDLRWTAQPPIELELRGYTMIGNMESGTVETGVLSPNSHDERAK